MWISVLSADWTVSSEHRRHVTDKVMFSLNYAGIKSTGWYAVAVEFRRNNLLVSVHT